MYAKGVIRYVCFVPALTTTNPQFKKSGLLKLKWCVKSLICKLMCNTITGFDVEHNRFTLASSVHLHNTRFSKKKKNFITERPRTRLDLNCFRYRIPSFGLEYLTFLKTLKKFVLNIVIIILKITTRVDLDFFCMFLSWN